MPRRECDDKDALAVIGLLWALVSGSKADGANACRNPKRSSNLNHPGIVFTFDRVFQQNAEVRMAST
jgi:hypothetical protein